jgi:ATP-binding cassette, subfamily B, multidrug efflux pump
MRNLFRHIRPYTLQILAVVALVYVQVMTDLALPEYMSKIVNEGIIAKDNALILSTGGQMLLVTLYGAVATIIAGYLAARVATGLARDLRSSVFSKVESFSLKEFDTFSTSSLITRSTNDIQQIQMVFFLILRMVVSAPIMGIGAVIKANNTAPSLSWIILLAVIILFGMIMVMFVIAMPKFKILQKLVDKLNLVTRENLTGLRVIRAFTNEKYEEEKFEKANEDLMKVNLFVNRLMVVFQPVMMLVLNVATLAIIWVGAKLIDADGLQIGDMMAFMQYAMQVIMSFLMLSMIFILVPRATVSVGRIEEVLNSDPDIKDPKKPKKFDGKVKGKVEFKRVTFAYSHSDTPVLKNISFVAEPGQTTAIIGSTGCGKSTLINLIPRFYDATSGEVLVDDLNVREVRQEELHNKLGYVPQKGVLFSGTVKSNITYGAEKASKKEVTEAARIAQASEFINKMAGTYDAPIAQGGSNVSGGQKQRISIARAVVRKPEIYIFDDSFSALDFRTDAALRQALAKETKGATVLIVTQRVSTVLHADKIVVMDEGNIEGIGTHEELLKTCPVYKEIALSQLSEQELKNVAAKNHIKGGKGTT